MRKQERGAVLILVLASVAILTIVTVELASRASAEALRAARATRAAAHRRLSDSGVEVARALLLQQAQTGFHYWGDSWNQEISFALAPGETAVVRIEDESGKLNIARIYLHPSEAASIRKMLVRLFDYLKRHEAQRAHLWSETERKLMARLALPRPLVTLDGLREGDLTREEVFGNAGLARYVTCFGDGKININTAPRAVLYASCSEFDEALIERIAGFRGKGEGRPGSYTPFKSGKDLLLIDGISIRAHVEGHPDIARNLYEETQKVLTVSSSCFSARIISKVSEHSAEAWVFLTPGAVRLAFEELLP